MTRTDKTTATDDGQLFRRGKNGAFSLDGANWISYTGSFTISRQGITIVRYRSTDRAGNIETIKIETVLIKARR